MNSCYSSNKVMEEIKCRIKDKFKNQENFGKELGASRKTVSRILNHGTDIVTFFRICKILGIDGISIDWYSFFLPFRGQKLIFHLLYAKITKVKPITIVYLD